MTSGSNTGLTHNLCQGNREENRRRSPENQGFEQVYNRCCAENARDRMLKEAARVVHARIRAAPVWRLDEGAASGAVRTAPVVQRSGYFWPRIHFASFAASSGLTVALGGMKGRVACPVFCQPTPAVLVCL